MLPIYAEDLGANSAVIEYHLAFIYITIALGSLIAGWISDGYHQRKFPLIIASLIVVPLTLLMGYVHRIWELVALTAILWFCAGILLALISVFAGLSVGENDRGKIFRVLVLTGGLGALVGNLLVGWLADQ